MPIGKKTAPFALSRSLKVIGTDTDRSVTLDFLETSHSNRGPILYRVQDIRYWPKIANFYTQPLFNVPHRVFRSDWL